MDDSNKLYVAKNFKQSKFNLILYVEQTIFNGFMNFILKKLEFDWKQMHVLILYVTVPFICQKKLKTKTCTQIAIFIICKNKHISENFALY